MAKGTNKQGTRDKTTTVGVRTVTLAIMTQEVENVERVPDGVGGDGRLEIRGLGIGDGRSDGRDVMMGGFVVGCRVN